MIFEDKIYHPLINSNTGELDINYLFSKWIPSKNTAIQLIYKIKDIFINPRYFLVTNSLNKECGQLFCDNYIELENKVQENIKSMKNKNNNVDNDNSIFISNFIELLENKEYSSNTTQEEILNILKDCYKTNLNNK